MQRKNDIERSPTHLLHRASQCAEEIFQAAMASGITPRQLAILMTIAVEEGLSQTELTERTGVDRSTMADVVRRLMKKGYVQRRRSGKDARAYELKLTGKGREFLNGAEPVARRVDARVLDALPKGRRDAFVAALAAIIAALV
jgi:DNA-binding MarR family transcriptional regulator